MPPASKRAGPRLLGRDGLGEVFSETRSRSTVILRRIPLPPEAAKDVAPEITAAAKIRAPGILALVDVDVQEGVVLLRYEAVEGRTLRDLLSVLAAGNEKLQVSHATWIAAELLKALKVAHGHTENGIISPVTHGRISPEHVIIDAKGQVHLTGFGLDAAARHLLRAQDPVSRAFAYVAPEQTSGGATVPASDVYSVATVVVEGVLGAPLFLKNTQEETWQAIANDPVPALRAKRPEVPMALEQLLIFAMNKGVDGRCPRAEVMLDRINAFQGILEVGDRVKPGDHAARLSDLVRMRLGGPARIAVGVSTLTTEVTSEEVDTGAAATRGAKKRSLILPRRRSAARRGVLLMFLLVVLVGVTFGVPSVREVVLPLLPPDVRVAVNSALDRVGDAVPEGVRNVVGLSRPARPKPAPQRAPPAEAHPAPSATPPTSAAPPSMAAPVPAPAAPSPPAPKEPAVLSIRTTPPATVSVDGKRVGRTPVEVKDLTPGEHTLEFETDKPRIRSTQKITLAAGEKKSFELRLRKR